MSDRSEDRLKTLEDKLEMLSLPQVTTVVNLPEEKDQIVPYPA